jgi:uncharacterized lipoprotein YmbA
VTLAARNRLLARLVLGVLLFGGCLGRSPTTEFYSLRAVEVATRASTAQDEGVAIGVGPVRLPRFLQRPQLARRSGESEIQYDEFRRWAGGLDDELVRVLGANLSTLLETERVVVYPAEAPFPLAYRVIIDVERFEAGPDDAVTLNARWVVLPGGPGDALAVQRTDLVQAARSGAPADLVAAHSAAAAALSRAIADRLRTLPPTP